jgi:hypothetical protein
MYQQPHLVPPMKLTVWDELPPTPPPTMPAHITSLVSQGRSLASRASGRASQSIRRKPASRPVISSPQPAVTAPGDRPFRRRSFRPLELSIYLPSNRLSNLPEFDAMSFTEVGEIKFPPRALTRTKSEEILPFMSVPEPVAPKPASMYERRMSHMRSNTISSVISTSRPPSSHDALRSHPVSWCSHPDLPPQVQMVMRPEQIIDILTPMQEEFTPPATAGLINDIVMDFPQIENKQEVARNSYLPPEVEPAPSPKIPATAPERPPPSFVKEDPHPANTYFHTNYQTQKRISQWLNTRSRSSSISTMKSMSTVKSSSTSTSFAEHRRKRSQFYQLSANQGPPQPLRLRSHHQHKRSMTVSTVASTVDTNIMSLDDDDMESMTTAPTASEIQSRTGTVKSVSAGTGVMRPIVSGVPVLPDDYDHVVSEKEAEAFVFTEINGPLRSPMHQPGVGLAF